MAEGQHDPADTAGREITATREFDAPRDLVFRMWADPQHVAKWWGPNGFTNTIHEMDVRPGGVWRFVMHGPDGTDYPNRNVYVEVVPPERIVLDHASSPPFRMTATFDDLGGRRTRLSVRMMFETAVLRDKVAKEFGAVEGLNQTLNRLGEHAAAQGAAGSTAGRPFVIARTFDAPRDVVWRAWTERDRLMKWFGPKGFTMPAAKLDLRPGGTFHYQLQSPTGQEMWGRFVFREVTPPERLVWVNSFSDEHGGLGRHPFSESWPQEMLTTATFVEHAGRTTVTIYWEPLNASAAERQTFDAGRDSMRQGWGGTFDQLAAYLAGAQAG